MQGGRGAGNDKYDDRSNSRSSDRCNDKEQQTAAASETTGVMVSGRSDTMQRIGEKIQDQMAQLHTQLNIRGPRRSSESYDARLREVCSEFEGILLTQMLRVMRQSLPEEGIFPSSPSTKVWESQYEVALGRSGSLGLGRLLYERLSQKAIEGQL